MAERRIVRALGPVILATRLSPWSARRAIGAYRNSAFALCLIAHPTRWQVDGRELLCSARSGLLLDLSASSDASCTGDSDLVLLAPRRLVQPGADRCPVDYLPPSAALDVLHRVATTASDPKVAPTEAQMRLVGRALAELMTVAMTPWARVGDDVASRRDLALLDRLVTYIDAHLACDLNVETLGMAMRCSRSALYRAVATSGGVGALVDQRRLAAVHERLRDPSERRRIVEIARTSGLPDPARFSRIFKRRYGITAAELRQLSRANGNTEPR